MSGSNIIPNCLLSSFRLSHDDPHRILGEWIIGSFFEGITIIFNVIIINIIIIVTTFEKYGEYRHPPIKSFVCYSPSISSAVRSGHTDSELLCPFLFYMVRWLAVQSLLSALKNWVVGWNFEISWSYESQDKPLFFYGTLAGPIFRLLSTICPIWGNLHSRIDKI